MLKPWVRQLNTLSQSHSEFGFDPTRKYEEQRWETKEKTVGIQ